MITSTQTFPGVGQAPRLGAFLHRAPEVQDVPQFTPYHVADRWHLSKLCAKLGIPHRDAEKKFVLIQMLLSAEESGHVRRDNALVLLDDIMLSMSRLAAQNAQSREWVQLEAPSIHGPHPSAPQAPTAEPPSPESELWRFAKLNTIELMEEAKKLGLIFTRADKRAVIMEALEKHLKKS